ncbi:limbin [Tachyglossus aculeatus]|uniref:limbin n=1 Tax=Tachyglossus aculeatus TaxID=9261 RepID=UPI0018F73A7F|nr:limbin [Tachyglossus aculeatus]
MGRAGGEGGKGRPGASSPLLLGVTFLLQLAAGSRLCLPDRGYQPQAVASSYREPSGIAPALVRLVGGQGLPHDEEDREEEEEEEEEEEAGPRTALAQDFLLKKDADEASCRSSTAGIRHRTKDRNLLLTSAASNNQWSSSLFSLMPSWTQKILYKRESSITHPLHEDPSRPSVTSEFGITFQKCAMVSSQRDPQAASVRLLINNTNTPRASNLSDLVLLDNITGLVVQGSTGNRTSDGLQVFRKMFLPVGDYYAVNYIAFINAKEVKSNGILTLPAQLTFNSSSLNKTVLKAFFSITGQDKTKVALNPGLHAAGFFIGFIVSLVVTSIVFLCIYHYQGFRWSILNNDWAQQSIPQANFLEYSHFTFADALHEKFPSDDRILEILAFDEADNMLQALKDLEMADLNRADAELEAYREQICKDVIALSLKAMVASDHLTPLLEKTMSSAFRSLFAGLDGEVREEYKRKVVALTAECDLETRKKTEAQARREAADREEAEELLNRVNEKSASEYRSLLDNLHRLEREQTQRSLWVKREEDFAKAYRQLAIFQRNEIHKIFFTQIKSVLLKGELKLEAAKTLLLDYSKRQAEIEELMDYLQANKKYHLSQRFASRECLIGNIRISESRAQGFLNTAATQLIGLVNKTERAGYLDENQMRILLDRAQAEVLSVRHKLENDLKHEKKKLHQKLMIRRRQEILLKRKEHQKEQLSLGEATRTSKEVGPYLRRWQELLRDSEAASEGSMDRLDATAAEELKGLRDNLTQKAVEDLGRVRHGALAQELWKLDVPRLFVQRLLEEQDRELALRAEQLQQAERDAGRDARESLRKTGQKLKEELESGLAAQKELRDRERLVFTKLLCLPLSLSEEQLHKMKQEFHCCFSQLDSSLALPKIRTRVLLQNFQSDWIEAELLKLNQALSVPEVQQQSKMKKQRCKTRSKTEVLKQLVEDKIHIFEEPVSEDIIEKAHSELLLERGRQVKAQENKLGGYIAALQFQKADKKSETFEIYTTLLSVQGLLLEELSMSETLTESACAQILESRGSEIEELDRKLESELAHKESSRQQQAVLNRQRWISDGLGLLKEDGEIDSERQMSALLWQALKKCPRLIELYNQSLREELQSLVVFEDRLESLEMDAFLNLYTQDLRLAAYLSKLTVIPEGLLPRLLNFLLPASSQNELLPVLESIREKYSEDAAASDSDGEQTESARKRKHQSSWQALESKLRRDLINRGLDMALDAGRKKESILKKKPLPPRARPSPSRRNSPPKLSMEAVSEQDSMNYAAVETEDALGKGEKIFIFTNQEDAVRPIQACPKKKKKKNFLNSKKSTLVTSGKSLEGNLVGKSVYCGKDVNTVGE